MVAAVLIFFIVEVCMLLIYSILLSQFIPNRKTCS